MFADLPDDHRLWLNAMNFKIKMLEGHMKRSGDASLTAWFTSRAFSLARWQKRNRKENIAQLDRLIERLATHYPGKLHPDSYLNLKRCSQKDRLEEFASSILIQAIRFDDEKAATSFPLESQNREGLINLLSDLEETCKLAKELSTYAAN